MTRLSHPIIKTAVALIVVVLLILAVDSGAQWPTLEQWFEIFAADSRPMAVLVVLTVIVSLSIRGIRWIRLMDNGLPVARDIALAGFGWCFLLLQLLPFRSGEVARVLWIKQRNGSAIDTAASIAIERVTDAVFLLCLMGLTAVFAPQIAGLLDAVAVTAVALVLAGYLVISFLAVRLKTLIAPYRGRSRIADGAVHAITAFEQARRHGRQGMVILLTAAAWLLLAAAFAAYITALHEVSWVAGPAVLALVNLSSLVTFTPGNIIVFEAVGTLALVTLGVPAEAAIVTVTGLHLAVLTGQVLTGGISRLYLLFREKR